MLPTTTTTEVSPAEAVVAVFFDKLSNALTLPSWNVALKEVWDGIPGGVGGAIGAMAFKEIVGPSKWEAEVSRKLDTIILKLDQLIAEVQALRAFITEELLKRWRETLAAELNGRIHDIARCIAAARKTGKLDGADYKLMEATSQELRASISKICNYADDSGRPMGIALYVAIAGAVPFLIVSQRLIGLSSANSAEDLDYFASVMMSWAAEMDKTAAAMIKEVQNLEANLATLPTSGFVSWTGLDGNDFLGFDPKAPKYADYLCYSYAQLSDGKRDDFHVINVQINELGSYLELVAMPANPIGEVLTTKFPLLPWPEPFPADYRDLGNGNNFAIQHTAEYTRTLDTMVKQMNDWRHEIVARWAEVRRVEGVALSMREAAAYFMGLKT